MKKNFTNNMAPTYITALSIIAMLSIASYVTLKKRISSQETDAAVINLTSKQRFLLQNIAIYSLCLVNAKDRAETGCCGSAHPWCEIRQAYHESVPDQS